MNIQGKVALVTGGASGLGAASVRMVTDAGGRAVIVDLNQELGQLLAGEIGDAACFVRADVANPSDMEAAVNAALERFGRLDIDVNCAGIGNAARVIGKEGPVSLDWFTRVINVNLVGTFNTIRLAAAAMARNEPGEDGERGVIINTASIAAFDGQIGQAAYSASKGGIVGMTLPLARDLARHGIRVMTIAPGIFDTPLLGQLPEAIRMSLSQSIPFPQRLGSPDDYATLARHIIENTMLNGEVIRLDGALRMAPK
jgi:NAD(P)-dependent dehydrogenase (short-subunit alcohol dehydrogenase family)